MTLRSLDFSTFNIKSVQPVAVANLFQQGFRHAVIGFDSAPESAAVLHTFLDGGFAWDAYRFLYADRPINAQIDDVVAGIRNAGLSKDQLPGFIWLDVEPVPSGLIPSTAMISQAMDRLEGYGVKPAGELVRPGIYTGAWVWNGYFQGYTEPARRNWALWAAEWTGTDIDAVSLYGGWTRAEGRQTSGDTVSVIGTIDLDMFRDRTGTTPVPPTPEPLPNSVSHEEFDVVAAAVDVLKKQMEAVHTGSGN